MSQAGKILEALASGNKDEALALAKLHMTESSSELIAAGTQYILQTAVDTYTDGTSGDLNEEEEQEEEEEEEEEE